MFKRIPGYFINKLLELTNIIDVIKERLNIKKIGRNYATKCPFHNEENPSFMIKTDGQFYHCFGCGVHGNVIDFLMRYEQLSFTESIKKLALYNNIDIPYKAYPNKISSKEFNYKISLYNLMDKINIIYQHNLNDKMGIKANIFLKNRKINKESIINFNIGFALPIWNYIAKIFRNSTNELNLLKDIGMIVTKNNGFEYDFFRNRIMFPVRDEKGYIIAFGGRTLDDKNKLYPKYLNSPKNKIFNKNQCLYGLYEIQKNRINTNKLLVVEGYIDVISLSQFNINYAVASLGTSITTDQIKLLYRITDHIICCYDGDYAGREAAWRTLNNVLPYLFDGRQFCFLFLPEGEDPDTLIHKIGKEKFELLIKQAQPLSNFLFNTLVSKVDFSSPETSTKLSTLSLPLIKKIPGKFLRLCLYKELNRRLGIINYNKKNISIKPILSRNIFIESDKILIRYKNIRTLIGLLLQYPKLSSLVSSVKELSKINKPGITLFIELIRICKSNEKLNTGQLLEFYRKKKSYFYLVKLSTWNHFISNEMIEKIFLDTLLNLYNNIYIQKQEKLLIKDRIYGLSSIEKKELWSINKKLAKIIK